VTSFMESKEQKNLKVLMSVKGQDLSFVESPFLEFKISPNGTGDLFSALFLGHYIRTKHDAKKSLELATSGIFTTLQNTLKAGQRELQLITSQDAFAPEKMNELIKTN